MSSASGSAPNPAEKRQGGGFFAQLWRRLRKPGLLRPTHPQYDDIFARIRELADDNSAGDRRLWRILRGALGISEVQVGDIMVPRAQMVFFVEGSTVSQVRAEVVRSGHSRFPVVDEEEHRVLGILFAKDLLACDEDGKVIDELLHKSLMVPASKKALALLEEFRSQRNHIAIVVDEFSAIEGLVTIEDVLEEIVGEIEDEHDQVHKGPITSTQDGAFLVSADTTIEEFNRVFRTGFDEKRADTIGGILLHAFGRLPETGAEIDIDGLNYHVEKADQRRIKSVVVTRLKAGSPRAAKKG